MTKKKKKQKKKNFFDLNEFDNSEDEFFENIKENNSDEDNEEDGDDTEPVFDENILKAFYKFYEYSKQEKKKNENKILPCLRIFINSRVNKRIELIKNNKIFKNLVFIVKNILNGKIILHEEIEPFHKKMLMRSLKQPCNDDIKHLLSEDIKTFYMLEDAYKIIINNGK